MKPQPSRPAAAEATAAPEHPRQRLSAAIDGDAGALDAVCALWRDDEQSRRDWHTWHLIGDVMRSNELAAPPARDADFLTGLRARLANEPVILAPEPVPARRRQPWLVPAAAAAGFAVVAGVLMVARMGPAVAPAGPVLAGASAPPAGAQLVSAPVRVQSVPAMARGDGFIRDPRLDELMRAHQFVRGGAAMTAPREGLRNMEVPGPMPAPAPR